MPQTRPQRRASWAKQIREAWQRSIEAILEVGRLLEAAKDALPHGQFERMVEHDLPFGPRAARQLMHIARSPVLSNRKHASDLPASWYTLYELSRLPEPALRRALKSGDVGPETTRAHVVALKQELDHQDRIKASASNGSKTCTESDLYRLIKDGQTFRTVYADPPWPFDNASGRGNAHRHYRTMELDDIRNLPVADLAAKNAHLHLWSPVSFLEEAYKLVRYWGFEPKSQLVWVKDQLGTGNYWRVSHELLILGVRGSARFLDRSQRSWVKLPRSLHSEKPEPIRKLIEQVSPAPRLELFARSVSPGWTVWGDEIPAEALDSSDAA